MVRHAERKFGKFVDWDLSIQFDRESPAGVRILRVMVCGSSIPNLKFARSRKAFRSG
jgi:hypothetical protein